MANKVALEDVEVKLQLMKLKSFQVVWITKFFNEMATSKGSEITGSGWNASGIKDAIKLGTGKLPSLDPFEELDPMMNETEDIAQSTMLRMTAIACLSIGELEVLGSMEDDENIDEEEDDGSIVYGSINLLNWMGKMLSTCLITRCKSNRDDILYCFILITLIFL